MWTSQTQASFGGDTKLTWEETWRWQVPLLNSREAVLFPWKPQSWFVSEWNASVSLPYETVTAWRTGSTLLHWNAWILPKCRSLLLPPSPSWKICIGNPTLLLLHLFHIWGSKKEKRERWWKWLWCTVRTLWGEEDRNTQIADCAPKTFKTILPHELPGTVFHCPMKTAGYGLRENTAINHIPGSEEQQSWWRV